MQPEFPAIVCAGEALTDLVASGPGQWTSRAGGSTWNVARALAAQGMAAAFAGAISEDLFGDALWNASAASGLDLRFLQRAPKAPLLAVVEAEPPRYFFIGADSADLQFDPQRLPEGWLGKAQWLHVGGISLAREPLAATLVALAEQAKAAGVRISYDPNFRTLMDARYDRTLQRMSALADVIKVSDDDLRGLFRTDAVERAFAELRRFNPHAAYLFTRGAQGASLHLGAHQWRAAAPQVTVADTLGAGDASIAGLLASLSAFPAHGWQQHLNIAVASGAAACLAAGAHAPSRAQVLALFSTMPD